MPVANFRVFDLMSYTGKPSLTSYGIEQTSIVYESELFGVADAKWHADVAKFGYPVAYPPTHGVRNAGRARKGQANVVIDFERMIAYGVPRIQYQKHIDRFADLFRRFKTACGGSTAVGFYGPPPVYDYGRIIGAIPASLAADNDAIKGLAAMMDVLYPAAYTLTTDQSTWTTATTNTINEARRIAPNKPLYVFLWPRYHDYVGAPNAGQFLPDTYWRAQLDHIYNSNADGCVIWDGSTAAWDGNAAWWTQTTNFLQTIGKY